MNYAHAGKIEFFDYNLNFIEISTADVKVLYCLKIIPETFYDHWKWMKNYCHFN